MRAVVQDHYGGTDRLRLADRPDPAPGKGEVLVRVSAAGIDRGTVHVMTGRPLLARLGLGLRRPRFPVPGRDLCGTVVALGAGVTTVAIGDRVVGTADGSCAELAVVPVARLAAAPRTLGDEEAAALPVSGLTALQAVRAAAVGPGQRVLVVGASGGVGTYAVQLAAAAGARVTGVCSRAKADLVRGLGAAHVVTHEDADVDAEGVRYDAVLDIGGHRSLRTLRAVLAPRGTLVVVGSEAPGRWLGGLERSVGAALLSPFVRQRLVMHVARERADDLAELVRLVDTGAVRPVLDHVVPLASTAAAIDHVAAGRARGKVVVRVAGRGAESAAGEAPVSEDAGRAAATPRP
ncbi:NAD(P)-dependent alcohol dehydrogenase [Arthrobacter sp. NEB 688]|uniref:NAD(P)-dependent alcohol dehydrogenase n=1 Tax=Arthrobacter sp. NEB 688 TaxID=904039 RepID=UPI00156385B5|nr:NAD(P)-dependent alcohol dehydrogenase [Arthrobacter sp. NEB 688]QKE83301.1 NAD(P)-dependent alcohol dehydrogenase [Arthrobacter sp. NEB 688]